MNVLLIHQAFVSPGEAGGTRHFEFARYCVEHNESFTVIASEISYLSGKRFEGDSSGETPGGVHILRAKVYSGLHRSFLRRVLSFVTFMVSAFWLGLRAETPDLVMGTSPPMFQALSAWLLAVVRRRPFLLEIRDLWPEFAIDMGVLRNSLLISASRMAERFLYNRADHILVNSPAYREYLLEKGISATRITLIPNGVDVSVFENRSPTMDIRSEYGLESKFLVTYAGALGIANDIQLILRAALALKQYDDVHFLLVGDGMERANLDRFCQEKGLTNVTFAGARPKSTIPGILASSDACVASLQNIPMFRMTYPNKVFDYMAAAKPTILAIDGVIRDVIEQAGGGIYVPPGDDDALSSAVIRLRKNPNEGQQMGQRAFEYVKTHFNRSDHALAFLELARRLVIQKLAA